MKQLDRYSRQRMLPEIGDAGQESVATTQFVVAGDLPPEAQKAAALYAAACGFPQSGPFERSAAGAPSPGVAVHFRHDAARDLAWGASSVIQAFGRAIRKSALTASLPSQEKE